MPWKPSSARSKTRKANTPAKRKRWSRVANAVLKRTGSESSAIRIANAQMKKRGKKRRPRR